MIVPVSGIESLSPSMLFTCTDDMFLSRCNSKSRRKLQANSMSCPLTVELGTKIGNDLLKLINENSSIPLGKCWLRGSKEKERKDFFKAFEMFRKTQPERVKNQLPRESPTGEIQEVTLKGWNHHERREP